MGLEARKVKGKQGGERCEEKKSKAEVGGEQGRDTAGEEGEGDQFHRKRQKIES